MTTAGDRACDGLMLSCAPLGAGGRALPEKAPAALPHAAGAAFAEGPPRALAAVAAAICRDLYPKNVVPHQQQLPWQQWAGGGAAAADAAQGVSAAQAPLQQQQQQLPAAPPADAYRAAFLEKWCGPEGAAAGAAFVDTLRLHAAVLTMAHGGERFVMVAFRGTDGRLQGLLNNWALMAPVCLPLLLQGERAAAGGAGGGWGGWGGGGGGEGEGAEGQEGTALVHVHSAWWASLQAALPELKARIAEAVAWTRAAAAADAAAAAASSAGVARAQRQHHPKQQLQQPHRRGGRRPREPQPRVFFAGHSLGGAFAQLAAALTWRELRVGGVYAFGAPRVGDPEWARRYSSCLGPVTWAFVNAGDGVPSLPPVLPLMPYRQLHHSCVVGVCSSWGYGAAGYVRSSGSGSGSSSGGGSGGGSSDGSTRGGGGSSSGSSSRGRGGDSDSGQSDSSGGSASGLTARTLGAGGRPFPACRCLLSTAASINAWLDAQATAAAAAAASTEAGTAALGKGEAGSAQDAAAAAEGAAACSECSGGAGMTGRQLQRSRHNEHSYVDAVAAWLAAQVAAAAGGARAC